MNPKFVVIISLKYMKSQYMNQLPRIGGYFFNLKNLMNSMRFRKTPAISAIFSVIEFGWC